MRMRAGVWWSAAALAFLAITSALRTPQEQGATRTVRRLTAPSASDSNIVAASGPDIVQPTFRSRGSRRHEENTPQREPVRTRTRSRPEIPSSAQTLTQPNQSNERFDSRRTRTRSQPIDVESKKDASLIKETPVRSRSRGSSRRPSSTSPTPSRVESRRASSTTIPAPIESRRSFSTTSTSATIESKRITSTTSIPLPIESTLSSSTTSTSAPLDITSPVVDENTLSVISSSLSDITRVPKDFPTAATTLRRRNSLTTSTTTETIVAKRSRGRINTRSKARSLDLIVSGTTNTLSITDKVSTTSRTSSDVRNAKKLRYRTRPADTDTNLTGEGLITANEGDKSSQSKKSVPSQSETIIAAPVVLETVVQQSTEPNKQKTTTIKVTKVVRRPLSRGKVNFRPTASLPKISKVSDEISEDDNYPPSFKALLQAKNASKEANTPASDNLTPKASQKFLKIYSTSSQSTQTGPGTNKYLRLRNKQATEESITANKEQNKTVEESTPSTTIKPKTTEYKPRGTYNPRNRKSTFAPSSTQSSPLNLNSEKPAYKYNRKFKVSTTVATKPEIVKSNPIEQSIVIKKPFVRPSFYSRKLKDKIDSKTETPVSESVVSSIGVAQKLVLPRTSFYARTRNNINKNEIASTTEPTKQQLDEIVLKETTEPNDSPLVFALLNNSDDDEAVNIDTQPENNDNHMFMVAVTSTESVDNNPQNEVTNTAEESENKPVVNTAPTALKLDSDKYKYHANYKDQNSTNSNEKENRSSTAFPSVRNLQTKKYGRNRARPNFKEDISVTTPKPRERSIRKFSESFSKTTEPSNNGITPEPEKSKSRFSSKYRASYIDKPFYKPTIPTITSSTAWLKFYVTDHLLTKSVEEPNWFEGDIYTTESMSRLISTPYIHESSIELVNGII